MMRRTLVLGLACLLGGLALTNTAEACHRRRRCGCKNGGSYTYGGSTATNWGQPSYYPQASTGYYPASYPASQAAPGWNAPASPPAPYAEPAQPFAPPAPAAAAPAPSAAAQPATTAPG